MSSKRDREILNAIVNPLLPVGEGIFDDEEKVPKELKDEGEEDTKEFRYDTFFTFSWNSLPQVHVFLRAQEWTSSLRKNTSPHILVLKTHATPISAHSRPLPPKN